jgi:F0F1-type ATP synthase membrane subunit c/vacuolar-type H+-ATPase subunit K
MKKQILWIPIALLLTLFSCEEEEFKDDEFDLKASKIEQIGNLFDAIARQPELADVLIKSTENLYSNYTELLPLSDKAIVQRGKARGSAFSALFNSIARQPEAYNKLDSAATKFLGIYNSNDISDELLDITKTYTIAALNESIARQPEADSLFNLVSKKYLNFEILK